jgi:hypothetical protein
LLVVGPAAGGVRADEDFADGFAEEADEAVGGEDVSCPRPRSQGVVHRGGGDDDAVPRLTGQVRIRDLLHVLVEQQEQ